MFVTRTYSGSDKVFPQNLEDAKTVMAFWPAFLAFIFLIAWLCRLEFNINQREKDHDTLKESEEAKNVALWNKIDGLQNTLNQVLMAIGELKGKIDK